jgi:hypothetical protein
MAVAKIRERLAVSKQPVNGRIWIDSISRSKIREKLRKSIRL